MHEGRRWSTMTSGSAGHEQASRFAPDCCLGTSTASNEHEVHEETRVATSLQETALSFVAARLGYAELRNRQYHKHGMSWTRAVHCIWQIVAANGHLTQSN